MERRKHHAGAPRFGPDGPFKKTMAVDDPLATTVRGSTIDQLSFDAILAHAQQTPGSVAQLPGAPIDGLATDEVRLIPANAVTTD